MELSELDRRRERIRLPVIELARRASLDVHTVLRAFRGKNRPLHDNFLAMRNAIEAEERALLSHLLSLHPPASPPGPDEKAGQPVFQPPATLGLAAPEGEAA